MQRYFCCDHRRRAAVLASPLNGLDYLEVLDNDAPSESDRQLILLVFLLKPLGTVSLAPENFRITGGERIHDIQVTEVVTFSDSRVMRVRVNQWGDFSTYTLQIVDADNAPPAWLDPVLSAINFSFKVDCPSDFDCQTERVCPPEVSSSPDINYLAKDYASFRQLMLDRLSVLMPQGFERNPADIGMALVELLAYVGDHLSYRQDAIATEAYLGTARRRPSVRRHARLVDYFMHDGLNARVWVHVQVSADMSLPARIQLLTRVAGPPPFIAPNSSDYDRALQQQPVIFETLTDASLFATHNRLEFYTWGDQECCLPQGSTRATLRGHFPNLEIGDVLIFEEVLGPKTGLSGDADPTHRWAVRLTAVTLAADPIGGQLAEPPNDSAVNVTQIAWEGADALPFALCLSAITDDEHGEQFLDVVSVALGNIVLADHGATIPEEPIGTVPDVTLRQVPVAAGDRCKPVLGAPVIPRFRPQLAQGPLTQAEPYAMPIASAQAPFQREVAVALPDMHLSSELSEGTALWSPVRDLLNSDRQQLHFVVETETDGSASIRFGDDQYGLRPSAGTAFTATYRVGNGPQGNIGADTLAHAVSELGAIQRIRNPLSARGGLEPENLEQVRQAAPFAFRVQQRAVTLADYAAVTERHPEVQKAVATFRGTGSWRTVFVTIDRRGGLPVDAQFETEIRQHLEVFRMAGYDLEVDGPRFVSLEIEMTVCVQPNYFRSEVKAALLQAFSNHTLPDGRQGLFHPDQYTFGQSVYLSQIYAAAQAIAGVASVHITIFRRQGKPLTSALDTGILVMERLEIARLDNDPDFPEHGVLRLRMEGGK